MSLSAEIIFRSFKKNWIKKWMKSEENRSFLKKPQMLLDDNQLDQYHESLRKRGWYRIEDVATALLLSGLKSCWQYGGKQEVHVGDSPDTNWLEIQFEEDEDIGELIVRETVLKEFLFSPFDLQYTDVRVHSWINSYEVGEYIPKHKDADGFLQLLIGIQKPDNIDDPLLYIEDHGVKLNPGDVIVFRANQCEHYTVPLPSESEYPRINLAARFYES